MRRLCNLEMIGVLFFIVFCCCPCCINPNFVLRELVMDVMQEKLKGQFSELEAGKGKA